MERELRFCFYQARLRWVIDVLSNRAIPYSFDHLIHNKEWNEEPLPCRRGTLSILFVIRSAH